MFDLEKAIREWKKGFGKYELFEDGLIADMELHLRDAVAALQQAGLGDEEAFRKAMAQIGTAEHIAAEYRKNHELALDRRASWRPGRFMPALIWNYAKVSFRKFRRDKGYSTVNIAGLAIGLACCVFISLWIQDEMSFDRFHPNADRICRITMEHQGQWDVESPWALGDILGRNYPEVLSRARIRYEPISIIAGDKSVNVLAALTEPEFFDIFNFPLIAGDPGRALQSGDSIILTKTLSHSLFGSKNPLGGSLSVLDTKMPVAGVIDDLPANSHIQFKALLSVRLYGEDRIRSWAWEPNTYLLLRNRDDLRKLERKIVNLPRQYNVAGNQKSEIHLQPMVDVHLRNPGGGGRIVTIYLFTSLAALILIIACINFMNLSVARGETRAREVGLRKAFGSQRGQLVRQFFGESIMHSFAAMVLALGSVRLLLPAFNQLSRKQIDAAFLLSPGFMLAVCGITLVAGAISGSYPAFWLSAYPPSRTLNWGPRTSTGRSVLRQALVVLQFALAVVLMVGAVILHGQLSYIQHKDLGYQREQIITLPIDRPQRSKLRSFKDEILRNPAVASVTAATHPPNKVTAINPVSWEGLSPGQFQTVNWQAVEFDYLKTFRMKLAAGRDFDRERSTDRRHFIVNETLARRIGSKEVIGKRLSISNDKGEIIGVVKDFHTTSLHGQIQPLVLMLVSPNWPVDHVFIRVQAGQVEKILGDLREAWKRTFPQYPFDYRFLDDLFQQQYADDRQIFQVFQIGVVLALLIAGMGIFSLAAFMAQRRTKEIGIRKALGASVPLIVKLLFREYVALVGLANLIAWPPAYLLAKRLLQDYAYRIPISPWLFVSVAAATFVAAFLCVGMQAIKSARANPVESLRYE
ncbi:MAG TPA: ABC transporter permease [Patescibacteria group bacterium]|nr:ABC transporter permease [Patescibacteria group bacterium]